MNVPVAASGRLSVEPPTSGPGDFLRLRAEMDLIIGLTACSAYASNGGSFKPIHYVVEDGLPCRAAAPRSFLSRMADMAWSIWLRLEPVALNRPHTRRL
jgi:uncharacterized protein YcgI (DUF1989 family)